MNIELKKLGKLGSELGCSTTWPGHVPSLAGAGGRGWRGREQDIGWKPSTDLEPNAAEAEAVLSIQAS